MKYNILCKTLAGNPCPLITITSNVDTYFDYYNELKIQLKMPNMLKKQVKQKYQKAKKLYKQSMDSKGKVRKLLKAAFEEEIDSFFERHEESLKTIDPFFQNFNMKMKNYVQDHYHKKAIIITS